MILSDLRQQLECVLKQIALEYADSLLEKARETPILRAEILKAGAAEDRRRRLSYDPMISRRGFHVRPALVLF